MHVENDKLFQLKFMGNLRTAAFNADGGFPPLPHPSPAAVTTFCRSRESVKGLLAGDVDNPVLRRERR